MLRVVVFAVLLGSALPASVLAQPGSADCPVETGSSVRCYGHVLITAGTERLPVLVDGVEVGLTPLLLTRQHTDRPRVEVRRGPTPTGRARAVRMRRGRITLVDARVGAERRGQSARVGAFSWARYFSFDECDGYMSTSEPAVEAMRPADLGYLREYAHPADARRLLPTPAQLQAFYVRACEAGDGALCVVAGEAHSWASADGVDEDYARAAVLLRRGCDAQSAASCGLLARMIRYGRGVTPDAREAERLGALACRMGDSSSCP